MVRRRRWAIALLAALASMLAWAAPAQAHDRLVESVPAADSVLATAPEAITLRFGSELLDLEAVVIVRDATGEVLLTVSGQVDGALVTAPLPTALDDGSYSVAWRVISGDGAPVQGTFAFQVGLAAQVAPAAQTAQGSASAAPTATSAPESSASELSPPELVSGLPGWALGLAAVGAAGVAGAALVALRRRPRASELNASNSSTETHPTQETDAS